MRFMAGAAERSQQLQLGLNHSSKPLSDGLLALCHHGRHHLCACGNLVNQPHNLPCRPDPPICIPSCLCIPPTVPHDQGCHIGELYILALLLLDLFNLVPSWGYRRNWGGIEISAEGATWTSIATAFRNTLAVLCSARNMST